MEKITYVDSQEKRKDKIKISESIPIYIFPKSKENYPDIESHVYVCACDNSVSLYCSKIQFWLFHNNPVFYKHFESVGDCTFYRTFSTKWQQTVWLSRGHVIVYQGSRLIKWTIVRYYGYTGVSKARDFQQVSIQWHHLNVTL